MSVLIDIKTGDPESAGARYQLAGYAEAYGHEEAAGLKFDVDRHLYTVDGAVVPSVTQILRDTGVSLDFDDLGGMSKRIADAIELKRELGTALHADAHAFDDDDLAWETVNPEVLPYLEAWATFRGTYPHLKPATRERRVFHPAYRYAGTLDGIFLVGHETSVALNARWSVQLTPGKKVPYRITEYSDWRDADVWKSIVTTYYAQHARRRAA